MIFYGLRQTVADRPGHDRRYAIDASKIRRDLGWSPKETFDRAIHQTVRWYLDNPAWLDGVASDAGGEHVQQPEASRFTGRSWPRSCLRSARSFG